MSENVYNLNFIFRSNTKLELDAKVDDKNTLSDYLKEQIIEYNKGKNFFTIDGEPQIQLQPKDISVNLINETFVNIQINNQKYTYKKISDIKSTVIKDKEKLSKKINKKFNKKRTVTFLDLFESIKLSDDDDDETHAWDEQLRQKICSTDAKFTTNKVDELYGILLTYDNDEFDITLFDRKLLEESIVQVVSNYGPLTKELLALHVYCGSVKVVFNIYENDLRKKIKTNLTQIKQDILEIYSSKIKEKEDKKNLKTLLINTLYDYKKNPYNICDTNSMDCIKNKNVPLPYNDRYEKYSLKNIYDTPMETVEIVTDTPATTTTTQSQTTTTTTTTTTTQKPTTTTKREPYTCRTYITNKDDERVEPLNIDIDNDKINRIYNPFIFTSNENNICKKLYKYKYNNGVSFLENNSDNKIDKKTDCKFYKFIVNKNNNFDQNYTVLDNLVKNYCKRIM